MKHLLLLTTCALLAVSVFGQSPGRQFVLNGKINIDTGKAYLVPVSYDSSYYPIGTVFHRTAISKGKFVISGPCPQPSMFMLCVEVDSLPIYISDYFIVDTGVQDITCNVDSVREIPGIANKYMDELKSERGESLLNYARAHPKSFVVLWELIGKLIGRGYEPVLDSTYNSLADGIRNSYAGKVLANEMATMRRFAVGASFPELALLDTSMSNAEVDLSSRHVKYVLVDFWDSHCGPCISAFGELKKIYQENEPYGFTIVAVSTDEKKYIQNWKRVIREYQLPWPQYLDMGGQASSLFVKLLPTTFLLDSQGKIVKRDPDLKSLSLFLKEHIH